MELDDFKHKEIRKAADADDSLHNLLEAVKTADDQDRKRLLRLIRIFVFLFIIYFGSFAIKNGCLKEGFGLLIFTILLILAFTAYKYLRSKKINYSEPIASFLRKAENRYRLFTLTDAIISVPLLALLVYSGGLLVTCSFDKYFPGSPVPLIIYGIFMTAVVVTGLWATSKDWNKARKPVMDKIRELRKDVEEK